mmetsp:Transcript_6093/g.12408  ORF Transcript_6093/g.12408 Transcript_6093/m.12408 type:complete len:698 (+) Transcript_6093:757-2850(+)|eukprot:CAMPEP_0171543128 /NCGR_PEP_ID=MMETSP0960-20121227/2754_1 /TAXON_ID=87120 /ORGANISM="Aurantiochytrium limacinum, Strain ATCCMYA-1381" /LENGTH=697 /DNA_ID=CAMNT_0012090753 /DNA_START=638 /DNA_END=2731 /DNA_ORIENTATION=-
MSSRRSHRQIPNYNYDSPNSNIDDEEDIKVNRKRRSRKLKLTLDEEDDPDYNFDEENEGEDENEEDDDEDDEDDDDDDDDEDYVEDSGDMSGPLSDSSNMVNHRMTNRAVHILGNEKSRRKQQAGGKQAGGKWNPDEDERLKAVVKELGPKNWKVISKVAFDGARSDVQCLHRWQKVLRPGLVKGPWLESEDRVIIDLINAHGLGNIKWSEIAASLPGRLGKQCRERWVNHLDPDLRKDPWSEEEDRILLEQQGRLGNKWREIAAYLPGRSENSVKNRWNSARRKRKRSEAAKADGGKSDTKKGEKKPAKTKRGKATATRKESEGAPTSSVPTTEKVSKQLSAKRVKTTPVDIASTSSTDISSSPAGFMTGRTPSSFPSHSQFFNFGNYQYNSSEQAPPLPMPELRISTGQHAPPSPPGFQQFNFSNMSFANMSGMMFQPSSLLTSGLSSLSPPLSGDTEQFSPGQFNVDCTKLKGSISSSSSGDTSSNASNDSPSSTSRGYDISNATQMLPSFPSPDFSYLLKQQNEGGASQGKLNGGASGFMSGVQNAQATQLFKSNVPQSENTINQQQQQPSMTLQQMQHSMLSMPGLKNHFQQSSFPGLTSMQDYKDTSDLQNRAPSFEIIGHALSDAAKKYLFESSKNGIQNLPASVYNKLGNILPTDPDTTLEVLGMHSAPGKKIGEIFLHDGALRELQQR